MEKKKSWALRPVAWVCTIALMLGIQFLADLLWKLGRYAYYWLGRQSTVAIVILVLLFGGVFLSLVIYSAMLLPHFLVSLSDKIYPSSHAIRYYLCGAYEILGCAMLIYAGIVGAVSGVPMFWFYAQYIYLIVVSILIMVFGGSASKERILSKQTEALNTVLPKEKADGKAYCNACGSEIEINARYCSQCGARQDQTSKGTTGWKIPVILLTTVILVCLILAFAFWPRNNAVFQKENSNILPTETTMKRFAEPKSGTIHEGRQYNEKAGSKLTVHASPDRSCVVKLKTKMGTTYMSFYVRAGDTVTVSVLPSELYAYFAEGTDWYGWENNFGENTYFSKDSQPLIFYEYTFEYTLYEVSDGNLSLESIDSDDF